MSDTWLKKMRVREGQSQSDVAESLRISQAQYSRYEADPDTLPMSLLKALGVLLRFDWREIDNEEQSMQGVNPGDPYDTQRKQLWLLRKFIKEDEEGRASSARVASMGVDVPTIDDLEEKLRKYNYKPNVVLAGRFDTGKSYLANKLLGGDFLPSGHQPMTKLLCIIRHDSEQPKWQKESVRFLHRDFWKNGDSYTYDLSYLDDEKRCNTYRRYESELPSLHEYGRFWHGRQKKLRQDTKQLEAHTAVVYINSPLLEACNIIDTPGFSDQDADSLEEARLRPIQELMDVLIYTSTTNGFMDARDQAYLKYLLSLSNKGFERCPQHPTLANVFIVCTLASPTIIRDEALQSLLQSGADRLTDQIEDSVLKILRSDTDREYSMDEIDDRFFSFWAEDTKRHKDLVDRFVNYLSQVLPETYLSNFDLELNEFKKDGSDRISQAIGYYQKVRDDIEGARIKYQTIMEYAPEREREINRETRSLRVFIGSLKMSAKDSLRTRAANALTPSSLKSLITEKYGDDKKEAKENAPLLVFSKLEAVAKDMVMDDYDRKFRPQLESFAKLYSSLSFEPEVDKPGAIAIPFNFRRFFIDAFVGSSAIAIGASFGPVGLAVGIGIAVFGWIVNRQSWQERLAKQIINSFEENRCVAQLEDGIEQFWKGVEDSFDQLIAQAESDWEKSVLELEKMVDMDSMNIAQENIKHLEVLRLFFDRLHWSKID